MKNICLILHRFRENKKEAISKNFITLAEQLSLHSNISVTTFTPNSFQTRFKLSQISFKKKSRYSSLKAALINLYLLCKLVRADHQKFDVLNFHIASPVEVLMIYIFLPHKIIEKKVVLSLWQSYLSLSEVKRHFVYFMKNFSSNLHLLIGNSFIVAPIYRILLNQFCGTIVHCQYQKNQLERNRISKVEMIHNGVLPEIQINKRRFDQEVKTLVYIGHTKHSKGVNELLKTISVISKKHHIKLILIVSGFGDMKGMHEKINCLAINHIIELKQGIIDVFSELAKSQMLIVPFRTCVGTSLYPNVLIEAFSVGTPVAVPYFPELKNLLDGERNGLFIPFSDIDRCADDIISAINNPVKLEQISENQLKFFKKNLKMKNFVNRYKKFLTNED